MPAGAPLQKDLGLSNNFNNWAAKTDSDKQSSLLVRNVWILANKKNLVLMVSCSDMVTSAGCFALVISLDAAAPGHGIVVAG